MLSTRYDLRNFPHSLRVCYGSAPCGYKLSSRFHFRLPHRHLRRAYGVGALQFQCDPKPPLAFPTCQRRVAPLQTPIAPEPYCQPRSSHPWRKLPPTFHALGIDPAPSPDGRCADALTPLRQRWRPLRSLRAASGARHGGVGKLSNRKRILEIACRSTSYATPLCAVCSKLPALLRPRSPPLRATSSSPPIATSTPRLDRCICVKGERCCRMR